MTMPDANLAAALKQAKSKKMFFAFVPKGSDGKLIVSKMKIPAKLIAEAKKQVGGGTAVTGKCFGDGRALVFQVTRSAPSTMGSALKKVAQRDAGLVIIPDVQVAGDADAEEEEVNAAASTDAAAEGAASAAAPAARPAAASQGNVTGIQKALQKLGYDPGRIDGLMSPQTQAAIKQLQQENGLAANGNLDPKTQAALAKALRGGATPGAAQPPSPPPDEAPAPAVAGDADTPPDNQPAGVLNLGPWQAARQKAITELKALARKVAATKHGSAVGVVKEIQSILTRLPANPAPHEIDKLEEFVRHDDTITAAEEIPGRFHDLDIREPLLTALEALRQ
jgi:hypothetical protein